MLLQHLNARRLSLRRLTHLSNTRNINNTTPSQDSTASHILLDLLNIPLRRHRLLLRRVYTVMSSTRNTSNTNSIPTLNAALTSRIPFHPCTTTTDLTNRNRNRNRHPLRMLRTTHTLRGSRL